jgi:xylitol oxidase
VSVASTNWAGNLTYSADSIHHPTSVAEVQQLVAQHWRVKAVGTRHSFNAVADSPGGALISLSKLPPDIAVDTDAMTVSVTGGTRYGVLAGQLQSQGYALHNTGSLPHISVAGATATGTHGSGDRNGILSTAVSAVDLVTSDGSLLTVDRANLDLRALAVGLGAFGVITRLVLDIQPTYLVRVHRGGPRPTFPPDARFRRPDTDLRPDGHLLESLPREGRHPPKVLLERYVPRGLRRLTPTHSPR